jgi:hypothetical protein
VELTARVTGGHYLGDDKELGPIRTDELEPALAAEIEAGVRDGFFELSEQYTSDAADLEAHSLTVRDGTRAKTVVWDGLAQKPELLSTLVALLERSGQTWHPVSYSRP